LSSDFMDFDEERHRLITSLQRQGYLKSSPVIQAMETVPRHEFLPPAHNQTAYDDRPQDIGFGQTISAPHMNAVMCELLELVPGLSVLEIGAGSGYHAALCAHLVQGTSLGEDGHIYTIERIPELAQFAEQNIERVGLSSLITVICGDGTEGAPEYQPFDRILVTAAAPSIPPPLKDQLKVGGIFVIPVGNRAFYQNLIVVERKSEEKWEQKTIFGVVFVPLIGKYGFS
jgi:protein-L-isoaspartate(D-aspartate) O-methyltransferase